MTYWRLHYHLIWSTFERQPALNADREQILLMTLFAKAKELDCKVHAIGLAEDHATSLFQSRQN